MTKISQEKEPVAPKIKALDIFEKISFPKDRRRAVSNACYEIKCDTNNAKQFTTRTDSKKGIIMVIRTK